MLQGIQYSEGIIVWGLLSKFTFSCQHFHRIFIAFQSILLLLSYVIRLIWRGSCWQSSLPMRQYFYHDMPGEWLEVPVSGYSRQPLRFNNKERGRKREGKERKGMERKGARHGSHIRLCLPSSNHISNVLPAYPLCIHRKYQLRLPLIESIGPCSI